MTAFLIANIKITDDKWVPQYAASVHNIVHKHGGKYLSRSGNVKTLEGAPTDASLSGLWRFHRQNKQRPSLLIPNTPLTSRRDKAAVKAVFSSSTIPMCPEQYLI